MSTHPLVSFPAPPPSLLEPVDAVFSASSADAALRIAKRALGDEAMVLHTRTVHGPLGRRVELHATTSAHVQTLSLDALTQRSDAAAVLPSRLERLLREHDVPNRLARELVLRIGDPRGTAHDLASEVHRLVRTVVGFGDASRGGNRHIALVGPTGVGKTTTIAKLAARDALVERRKVALVSMDDYRIGGAEQLARYAELIGVPFEAARDEQSLKLALRKLGDFERVYIDTAGRNYRDAAPGIIQRLPELCPGIGIGLTLAAGTRTAELERAFVGYLSPRPSFLVLTKLDEAVLGGAALVAANHPRLDSPLPIAWVTDGQRVPEDIDAARAERIAGLLLAT